MATPEGAAIACMFCVAVYVRSCDRKFQPSVFQVLVIHNQVWHSIKAANRKGYSPATVYRSDCRIVRELNRESPWEFSRVLLESNQQWGAGSVNRVPSSSRNLSSLRSCRRSLSSISRRYLVLKTVNVSSSNRKGQGTAPRPDVTVCMC